MKIIIGHSNMDLDCLGSLALAGNLYPDHQGVASRIIHPVARNLYNLYRNHLELLPAQELRGKEVEKVVVVDTRSYQRVREYFALIDPPPREVEVYDHHPAESSDIPGAVVRTGAVGANTTLLGLEVMKRGINLTPEDATIALTGIYADTGNFTHENVKEEDFSVASFLIKQGASVELVRSFLKTLKEEHQITLFHEMLNRLVYRDFNGHFVILSYMELERQVGGLAAVVEKVSEVENPDALFSVFSFEKTQESLIIARAQAQGLDLPELLRPFGAAGHHRAASCLLKGSYGRRVLDDLQNHLQNALRPALTAEAIMTRQVESIGEGWSLLEASMFLEKASHTGVPVMENRGRLTGMLTLRDIMKGRKAGLMHAPVKAYMSRKLVTGTPATSLREIDSLFFKHNIGHLPILEQGRLVGLVTRDDYLKAIGGSPA